MVGVGGVLVPAVLDAALGPAQPSTAYVLVAAELVLESGAPSAEQVENMRNRLKEPPMPEAINSPLQISEEPIADTGRYDRLRDEVTDHA